MTSPLALRMKTSRVPSSSPPPMLLALLSHIAVAAAWSELRRRQKRQCRSPRPEPTSHHGGRLSALCRARDRKARRGDGCCPGGEQSFGGDVVSLGESPPPPWRRLKILTITAKKRQEDVSLGCGGGAAAVPAFGKCTQKAWSLLRCSPRRRSRLTRTIQLRGRSAPARSSSSFSTPSLTSKIEHTPRAPSSSLPYHSPIPSLTRASVCAAQARTIAFLLRCARLFPVAYHGLFLFID